MATLNNLPVSFRAGHSDETLRRVALLEDSPEEAQALKELLGANGVEVRHQTRAETFLNMLRRDSFDVLILDWNLPDATGYEVLRKVRDDLGLSIPVLMLTARSGEFEIVQALSGGASDYVIKPWRPFELLARLKVLMRGPVSAQRAPYQEVIEGWCFDAAQRQVSHGEVAVRLAGKEFEVARLLFRHLGRSVSREHITQTVWGGDAPSRTVDTHVSRVRVRLGLTAANGFQLQSIYGFGYRLDRVAPGAP